MAPRGWPGIALRHSIGCVLLVAAASCGYPRPELASDAPPDAPPEPGRPADPTYVKASNTDVGDRFGTSLASSRDGFTLAVGADWEDSAASGIDGDQTNNSAENAGAVYVLVFPRDGATTYVQRAYIKASNTDAGDHFGYSIALSGDGSTLAVGAYGEGSAAVGIGGDQIDNSAPRAGAVYVFARGGTTWIQQAYIKASNTDGGDRFGISVALSRDGSTLAVGADREASSATGIDGDQRDDSAPDAGAAYVFTRSGAEWSQQAYLKASNTGEGDVFGYSLALSGDGSLLAVGALNEDSTSGLEAADAGQDAGAVYIFTRSETTWRQKAYLKASNADPGDAFGSTVALSADGSTLAVGAAAEDSAAVGTGDDQADNSAESAGAVYVFARSGTTWSQQYVKASNTGARDRFGSSLALSDDGSFLAVGAANEDSAAKDFDGDQANDAAQDAGAVYVFRRSGMTWEQQIYVKASNPASNDHFGGRVALAGGGPMLMTSAAQEDSAATGIDGDQADDTADNAGAVYVYSLAGETL